MKKAQSLVEYMLIAALIAVAGYVFIAKVDLTKIRDYVFVRHTDAEHPSQIKIEAMTE